MIPIDIHVSRSKGRSKVKPTLHMLRKGGISVLQTSIFFFHFVGEYPILKGSTMGVKVSKEMERDNFSRFGQGIVGTASVILRDTLESFVPHKEIWNVVNNGTVQVRLNNHQKNFIKNAATDGYRHFDITLLYTLLRNVCSNLNNAATPNLPPPSQGWGKDPLPTDVTLSDDIERIRLLRNAVFAHLADSKLSKIEYKQYWGKLKDVCCRCTNNPRLHIFSRNYEVDLKDLEKYTVTEKDATEVIDLLSDMKGSYEIRYHRLNTKKKNNQIKLFIILACFCQYI